MKKKGIEKKHTYCKFIIFLTNKIKLNNNIQGWQMKKGTNPETIKEGEIITKNLS